MKKTHWSRATCLAAALFLGTGLSPLSAQGILNGLGGGGAGGQAAGGAGGAGAPRAGLGNRLDVNSSVRGVNPAQAVRGATNAGAGLGGGARAQAGLGAGATADGAGLRARGSAQGEGVPRGRTGLFTNTNVEADGGIDADVATDSSIDRRGLSGREHAGYQAEMTLNHRLAEIDRMRDHAISTGNTVQLAKADELEAQARATFQHRLDVIRTAPDANVIPPGEPRDIRSRIRAGMESQTSGASPEGANPVAADDTEEATDIVVQRPELFGRMRHRANADVGAAARSESRGLLHLSPRGGAPVASEDVAPRAEGRFAAGANPRGRIDATSDSLLEAEARAEQTAASRVRPLANSRFAADLQGQGSMQRVEPARGHSPFRGEVQVDPLETRGGMRRTRQEIEQVDYSASNGVEAGGRASGRMTGATYSEADAAIGNDPRAPRRSRAEATGAIREGRDADLNGWEGIEEADVRSDIRQETRTRFPADRNASGAFYGAGDATGRINGRKLSEAPVAPPADPRFRGRAATDFNAQSAVRGSDDVDSASSNIRGRTGSSMSGSSIRSRSQFDASAGAARQPVNPEEYGSRP